MTGAGSLALAALLAPGFGTQTAEPLPPGEIALHLSGGLILVDIQVPVAPILPLLTGEAEVVRGLTTGVDVRGRYATHLGVIHRLGPELRAGGGVGAGWSVGGRVHPSVRIGGAWQEDVDVAGDVATQLGLLATRRFAPVAVTAEAGLTVQWIVYEHIQERTRVDDRPYLAFYELALGLERPLASGVNLTMRLETSIPTEPAVPFTALGGYPRLLLGGGFPL